MAHTRRNKDRVCPRCGAHGPFALGARYQKRCDRCKADPRADMRPASKYAYDRARTEATRRLIAEHRDEFDAYMAEEQAAQASEEWSGVTLREIDDYERRVEEALAAGWLPSQ